MEKAGSYNFETLTKRADKVIERRNSNLVTLVITYQVEGETGAKFSIDWTIEGLTPHEDYPNHFLTIRQTRSGRGHQKYSIACDLIEREILKEHKLKLPDVDLVTGGLVGVEKKKIEKEIGAPIYEYVHFMFQPESFQGTPTAVEKFTLKSNVYDARSRVFPSLYEVRGGEENKFSYFLIDGLYYEAVGDPLQDAMEAVADKKKQLRLTFMNTTKPMLGSLEELLQVFPRYWYKGYLPMLEFGPELNFNSEMNSYSSVFFDKIILPHRNKMSIQRFRMPDELYTTFEEFKYAYKDDAKVMAKADAVRITDEAIIGEALPDFVVGSTVTIHNPKEAHEPLRGATGEVMGRKGLHIMVRFMGYDPFTNLFDIDEFRKK